MCSISGYISGSHQGEFRRVALSQLELIIGRASERGKDSSGLILLTDNGEQWQVKGIGHPREMLGQITDEVRMESPFLAINNNRAEPTTEYVENKTLADVQPFTFAGTIVSHNGIIANDKELLKLLAFGPGDVQTDIDSFVIAPLIKAFGVREALGMLTGSFALAIWHDDALWLACNYKPLFVMYDDWIDAIFFSSLDDYMRVEYWDNIRQLPPYSVTRIDSKTLEMETFRLPPYDGSIDHKERALVICSGGLDSVTVAAHYVQRDFDVTLLHFTYGCRAEEKEIEAVNAVADHFGLKAVFLDATTLFRDDIGHSRLTQKPNEREELMTEKGGEKSAELAYEWVPARNLVFYSLALAYAEAHGYDILALGNNLEESGAYPDNEMIFTRKFAELTPYALNLGKTVSIAQPVGNLMKHEIVKMGLENGTPFDLTWSCYEPGDVHCGTCGPCYMRKKAFEMNGEKDPVFEHMEYA